MALSHSGTVFGDAITCNIYFFVMGDCLRVLTTEREGY
jgi:hypothetical protein